MGFNFTIGIDNGDNNKKPRYILIFDSRDDLYAFCLSLIRASIECLSEESQADLKRIIGDMYEQVFSDEASSDEISECAVAVSLEDFSLLFAFMTIIMSAQYERRCEDGKTIEGLLDITATYERIIDELREDDYSVYTEYIDGVFN